MPLKQNKRQVIEKAENQTAIPKTRCQAPPSAVSLGAAPPRAQPSTQPPRPAAGPRLSSRPGWASALLTRGTGTSLLGGHALWGVWQLPGLTAPEAPSPSGEHHRVSRCCCSSAGRRLPVREQGREDVWGTCCCAECPPCREVRCAPGAPRRHRGNAVHGVPLQVRDGGSLLSLVSTISTTNSSKQRARAAPARWKAPSNNPPLRTEGKPFA